MAEDDFSEASESDIPGEIADAILAAAGAHEICGAVPAAPAVHAVAPDWRDHVEQRMRDWRQRSTSVHQLKLEHFMGDDDLDDLVDYVCDESADPALAAAAQPTADPMDWPLPCDVTVGSITIRAGCSLRTLVARMETLHQIARGQAKGSAQPLTPVALADKCESWLKTGIGTSNVVDAYEAGYRQCEADGSVKADAPVAQPLNLLTDARAELIAKRIVGDDQVAIVTALRIIRETECAHGITAAGQKGGA
jgi:hypothetical protein